MRYFVVVLVFAILGCTPQKTNYSGEYFRWHKNGKYALYNNKGERLTEALYSSSSYPSEGLIATRKGYLWGYLDKAGNEVIPFRYTRASNFENGLAIVYVNREKMGFIDKNGTMVIPPKFEFARHFSEGFCAVQKDGRWGFIDRSGKAITPFKYDRVESFKNGIAKVWIQDDKNIYSGYVDTKGRESLKIAHLFK